MGKSALLAPADDNGALAGAEINDFGFDLLRRLDSKGNLCASPASIALALAMVRPGVRGQTASEMDKVLHDFGTPGQAAEVVAMLQSFASQTVYDDSAWWDSHPDADPSATPDHTGLDPIAELDVSNALFSQKGMSLEQAYLNALSSGFGAGVGQLDFASDPQAAINIINKWASDRTKGRIPAILQPGDVDSSTRIELANAIYLKAAWTDPFDPAKTKPLPFTRALPRWLLTWMVTRAATNRGINLDNLRNQATILQDPSTVIHGETVPDEKRQPPEGDVVIRGEVER